MDRKVCEFIWELPSDNKHKIGWRIFRKAKQYLIFSKRCEMRRTENLFIVTARQETCLNSRTDITRQFPPRKSSTTDPVKTLETHLTNPRTFVTTARLRTPLSCCYTPFSTSFDTSILLLASNVDNHLRCLVHITLKTTSCHNSALARRHPYPTPPCLGIICLLFNHPSPCSLSFLGFLVDLQVSDKRPQEK